MCKLAGEQKRTKPLCVLFRLGSGCFPRAYSRGPRCVQDTGCTYCPSTALPLSFYSLCWGTLMSVSCGDFAGCRSSMLHPPGCRSSVLHPSAARPSHSWHIRVVVISKGLSLVFFRPRYFLQPRVQHSPCTSDVTAKANPSINPMFLVLYSLRLTSIYLHSKAPGELSDLKRLESARKDEFPFTTGRLRK